MAHLSPLDDGLNIYLIHLQAAIFEDVRPLCTPSNKSLQKEENASNLGNQLYL